MYANANGDFQDSGEFDLPAADSATSWHHIVVVSDGAANKTLFYLNGTYKGDSARASGETIYTVGNFDGGGQRFAQFIDDVRVYGGVLSQADVTAIYGGGNGDFGGIVTGEIVADLPAENGSVLFWGDKSGKGNHANSTNLGTTNKEPAYVTNQQNNLPSIFFDDDYLALTNDDSDSFDSLENMTIFVAGRATGNVGWSPIISKRGDGGQGWQFRQRGGDNRMCMTIRATTGTDDPGGNPYVNQKDGYHFWTVRYDGLKRLQRGDGRQEYEIDDSGAVMPATDRRVTLGARHDGGTGFNQRGKWKIAEILFYEKALAMDQVEKIEGYLAYKWGLSYQNSAHPYKNPANSYGIPVDFSEQAAGVDVSVYWGLSDGAESTTAWSNKAEIGNIYSVIKNSNQLKVKGFVITPNAAYFDFSDNGGLIGLSPSGESVLKAGPGNRGYDFNNDGDWRNHGHGINRNDQYMSLFEGTFTAKVTGDYEFGMQGNDDRGTLWLDLDQDGIFSRSGANGDERLADRQNCCGNHYKTVTLSAGDYMFASGHGEHGGGSNQELTIKTPAGAGPTGRTIVKPLDLNQDGLWSFSTLSNGENIGTQKEQLSLLENLVKNTTYHFRVFGTNSKGFDWADLTDTFVTENKLEFSYGTLTFDTSAATWEHSSGRSGSGTVVEKSWTSPLGDTLAYKKAEYKFDSIKLSGNLQVVFAGTNPLSLQTESNGDIEILVDLNASGGAGSGAETSPQSGVGGRGPGGIAVLGGGSGGESVEQNGQGRPGGEPTNLGGTTIVNAGGGFSNTGWQLEPRGAGGSYAGQGTGPVADDRGVVVGSTYGDRKLEAIFGGAGGSGASGWWDGGQQRERGAGAGGGGGGAIELSADGNGSVTIGTDVKILADGGGIPLLAHASNNLNGWNGGNGGGGAGGAIRLEGNNITNNGILSVTGGKRGHDFYGGAGGGGRIALIARKALIPGQYDISGGYNADGSTLVAGDGTLYVEASEGGMAVLEAVTGSVVIDTSAGTLLYSGPAGSGLAFGTVEDKIVSSGGLDYSYAVCTFTFDRINLAGSVIVQVKGNNALTLATRNHGDITVGADITLTGSTDSSAIAGGWKGGGAGGAGEGPGGGQLVTGAGGSYGGPGTGDASPVTYGDFDLNATVGGSGGSNSGAGGGGSVSLVAHGTGDVTISSTSNIVVNGGDGSAAASGSGSGGSIRVEGDTISNAGQLQAKGGAGSGKAGGGGRIAIHTTKEVVFGDVDAGNGSVAVIGDMGIKTLEYTTGKLVFDTGGASWFHYAGKHGQGQIMGGYNFNGKDIKAAVFEFEKIDIGADVEVVVTGPNALVLKETNGSGIVIKAHIRHDLADSGLSIESDGMVTLGRDDGTTATFSSNGAGGTLQIRGQGIINKGTLEAKGAGGRVILAYATAFVGDAGTIDAGQTIHLTLPSIFGTLDVNATYLIRTPIPNEEHMTAWFRFEEGSGTKTYSDVGGYEGAFQGLNGNLPEFVDGKFGKSIKFTRQEWVYTDAKPADMNVDGKKPRTVSFWFYTYNGQGSEAGLYGYGDQTCDAGENNNWSLRNLGRDNYKRFISQHWCWDPQSERWNGNNDQYKDKWVHVAHIYTGSNADSRVQLYFNGVMRNNWVRTQINTTQDNSNQCKLQLGRWTTWDNERRTMNGMLDDFRIYAKALDASEIGAIYNNGDGDGAVPPNNVFSIQATQNANRFTAAGLPAGLLLDDRTGKIAGATTAVGDHNVTIKAGNFLGFSDPQILTVKVLPIAPTFSTDAADFTSSDVLGNSAALNFKITDVGGEDANVTVYYDSSDKGTVAGDWGSSENMSTFQGVGDLSASLTGLSLGTAYHLRVQAQNSAGEGWTPNSITFTTSATPLPPVVTVYDANATTFTTTGATLIGRLRSHDATDAPTVTLYYGLVDKGLTDSGWDGNVAVGAPCRRAPTTQNP